MCGIAGFLGGDWTGQRKAETILRNMTSALRHRGPDGSGTWMDPEAGIGFAHDRLAIIDLSPTGEQPMQSHSGRFVISYNGEIYNHGELRERLSPGTNWRGTSDTEVLLEAIERFGVRGAVERARGMFAFALWDREQRSLTLARDRFGEKPLYYGIWRGSRPLLLFASELKAMKKHPDFPGEIDRDALTSLLRFGFIPAPSSIYQGVRKLLPGTLVTFSGDSIEGTPEAFWSAAEAASDGSRNPTIGGEEHILDQLEALLGQVISEQTVADVPVGAFLSGGIDSSTIVALMQKLSDRPVKTFTVGFQDKAYDEAADAMAVARHLGTDHSELYVSPSEARSVIPKLPQIYDEPFADSSQIPTYLICALARSEVKVALSGDGGDELFGGYRRHLAAANLWNGMSKVPYALRRSAAAMLGVVPSSAWPAVGWAGRRLLPQWMGSGDLTDALRRAPALFGSRSLSELYQGTISQWRGPESVVVGGTSGAAGLPEFASPGDLNNPAQQLMIADVAHYLPDDILVKVDRASMAVSLETRIPFLDQRMFDFAWRLPFDLRIKGTQSKAILRRLLYRHVPQALVDRPKMGFAVPLGEWLRGPLRDWAQSLLDPDLLKLQAFFEPGTVGRIWRDHLGGRVDEKRRLWPILIFQGWLNANDHRSA